MAQQLLAAHVSRGSGDGTHWVGAGPAHVDIVQIAESIEIFRRVVRVGAIEIGLAADEYRVVDVATGKMKELLQVSRR